MRKFALCMCVVIFPGCAELPASGPSSREVIVAAASDGERNSSPYKIVEITPAIAEIVGQSVISRGRFSTLPIRPARGIGVGDVLTISLYESGTGGLFSAKVEGDQNGAPHLTLPPQTVDNSGKVTVPYAGAIHVAGLSPQEAQAIIVKRLSSRAMEPQAIISVTSNASRLVTVTGDVERSGRVPLDTGKERLLDAVAMAGGAKGRQDDSFVKLTRGSLSEEMRLTALVQRPGENVQLQPGDQISVFQNPQKFVAMGASNTSAEINFASDNLTLAEAIGRAGGLDDHRSDPAGVFVFRYESDDVCRSLFGSSGGNAAEAVVYQLNLHNPASLLAAQRFPIKNRDVVYFANSSSTELGKFLNLLGLGVATTNGGAVAVARVMP